MDGADIVTPSDHPCQLTHQCRPPDPLHIRKNTQKPKFLISQTFRWKKFLPSKTFVMVLKNLPDYFIVKTVILRLGQLVLHQPSTRSGTLTHKLLCYVWATWFSTSPVVANIRHLDAQTVLLHLVQLVLYQPGVRHHDACLM